MLISSIQNRLFSSIRFVLVSSKKKNKEIVFLRVFKLKNINICIYLINARKLTITLISGQQAQDFFIF